MYENFGNESPGNDIAYNGPPGIHFDDHFLNVNFVDVHKYEASSELTSSKAVGVAGRLHANFSYWKETLQATEAVLDIIPNGYGLTFTSIPQDCFIKNNKSALMHPKFAEDALFKLLEDGCILEVSSPPRLLIRYLLQKGKKRHVNPHLHCPKFRYDDLACLSVIFEQNFWFFSWDLIGQWLGFMITL